LGQADEPCVEVVSRTPVFSDGLFRLQVDATAPEAIPEEVFSRVFRAAEKLFRGSLAMNGYEHPDYAWPPSDVKIEPAADFKSVSIYFLTRARKPPDIYRNVGPTPN
jgi:hypothetical protein